MDGGRCEDEGATVRRELHAGWLAMSVLLGSTAATSSVRGEERATSRPSAESERERAVRDFEEGRKAQIEGRLEEAELAYLRAWSRLRTFDIAANLGQVQLRLNKPASAAKHLAYGVRTVGPEIEPERLARMQALLSAAKAQVGTLRVWVKNVADAEVFVDGERVPAEELKHEIYVEPGEYRIVIRRAGYEDAMIEVAAVEGSREEIATALKPKMATRPGAAGAPVVGKVGEEKTKVPGAGAAVEEPRSWVPVVALGAASAVGLGVGVGLTAASNGARADADAQRDAILKARAHCVNPPTATPEQCAELHRTVSRVDTLGNGARVAYATAGALAIAALIYATWPGGRPASAVALEAGPGLNAGGAGIAVAGSW
ncbi:PEGA domain-containing protein [Sorangium sp. So ce693]|uniref:PEGA domain-containing protein n=1 Tax=Sorangium sp. So ce693 TaxID=3133318 RepID=UPI003F60F4BB